jgi:hypothetical protein
MSQRPRHFLSSDEETEAQPEAQPEAIVDKMPKKTPKKTHPGPMSSKKTPPAPLSVKKRALETPTETPRAKKAELQRGMYYCGSNSK